MAENLYIYGTFSVPGGVFTIPPWNVVQKVTLTQLEQVSPIYSAKFEDPTPLGSAKLSQRCPVPQGPAEKVIVLLRFWARANYTGAPVEKDHLIVTTTGPLALPTFAKAIIEALGEGG